MVFIGISYAGENVVIRVIDPGISHKSKRDTAAMFIAEIKSFLEKPISWCKVEPTGESEVFPSGDPDVYIVKVTGKISCPGEQIAHDYFSSIVNKYKDFLFYNSIVSDMISQKYPDLEFRCIQMNHTFAARIRYKKRDEWPLGWNYRNKIKFFKMVLNDEFISPNLQVIREFGSLIATEDDPTYSRTYPKEFTFKVYKKTVSKGSLKIRFEPVYHPTEEDFKTLTNME